MAPVRFNLRETRGGELGGHGVQHSDTVLHAAVRDHEHRLLQMENEQGPRLHDVHPLLRLRRRLADVRVRDAGLPGVGQPGPAEVSEPPYGGERRIGRDTVTAKRTHTHGRLVVIIAIIVGESRERDPPRFARAEGEPRRAVEGGRRTAIAGTIDHRHHHRSSGHGSFAYQDHVALRSSREEVYILYKSLEIPETKYSSC